jgi:hypothetical protein
LLKRSQLSSRHVGMSACSPTAKSQKVAFDDSQIASTPIECVEGFQIYDCWWVTGNSSLILSGKVCRQHTRKLPRAKQQAAWKGTLPADNSLLSLVNKRFHGISSIRGCEWAQSSSTARNPDQESALQSRILGTTMPVIEFALDPNESVTTKKEGYPK